MALFFVKIKEKNKIGNDFSLFSAWLLQTTTLTTTGVLGLAKVGFKLGKAFEGFQRL